MKKKILISALVLLSACCTGPYERKQYDFEIIATNGDTVYQSFAGCGDNMFSLKAGDLTTQSFTRTLVSGVRSYRLLGIKSLGMYSPKTHEDYELKPIPQPEKEVETPEITE